MNKYQEAIKELTDFVHSELDGTKMLNEHIGYIETIKEFVDKAYSNCFSVYINGTCPYYNQNIPTIEQVKQEWEELEYKWVESKFHYIYLRRFDDDNNIINEIIINFRDKSYDKRYGFITFQEHQLLTKTFRALGWFDERS